MRFYTQQHRFYCGIDLHARLLAICILDQAGTSVLQKQIGADKQVLLETLATFRPDEGNGTGAADKAAILRVQVPPCQLPESGT